MSVEHPIDQEIVSICVAQGVCHATGFEGVTKIEACTKSGMHADIAYIRVWKGDVAFAEFCQHNIVAVYFKGAS